jgi:hypothetical protein
MCISCDGALGEARGTYWDILLIMCEQIFPTHRVGPGVEMRADPVERRRRSGEELDMYTSME